MGRDEEEIMQKMEEYILRQKIENLQYKCLTVIEKSIKGSWAFNSVSYTHLTLPTSDLV